MRPHSYSLTAKQEEPPTAGVVYRSGDRVRVVGYHPPGATLEWVGRSGYIVNIKYSSRGTFLVEFDELQGLRRIHKAALKRIMLPVAERSPRTITREELDTLRTEWSFVCDNGRRLRWSRSRNAWVDEGPADGSETLILSSLRPQGPVP
jgi:hypothetical protein